MKIAHVICTFPPYKGGMGNSVYHAAKELGHLGHDSVVFTPAYHGATIGEEIIGPNTKVVRLKPLLAYGNAAVLPQLFYLLKNFDIVHLHYPFFGTADIVAIMALLYKKKLVVHYHMDVIGRGFKGIIFWLNVFLFLPVLARLASRITCASLDYIRHSQIGDFYINHKQAFIEVPFGVDTKTFIPGDYPRQPIILFVGGLDKQHYFKGVEQLIKAFGLIKNKYPLAKLTLVGQGDLEKYYTELAIKEGLGERFSIVNQVSDNDLVEYYQQALVTVLPSVNRGEAFGLVLLEAMACGTPVIASNLPGVRNVFQNHEHGLLVKSGDVEDLAKKLSYLLANEGLITKFGQAARLWVEQQYSWHKVAKRLEEVYLRILYTPKKIK